MTYRPQLSLIFPDFILISKITTTVTFRLTTSSDMHMPLYQHFIDGMASDCFMYSKGFISNFISLSIGFQFLIRVPRPFSLLKYMMQILWALTFLRDSLYLSAPEEGYMMADLPFIFDALSDKQCLILLDESRHAQPLWKRHGEVTASLSLHAFVNTYWELSLSDDESGIYLLTTYLWYIAFAAARRFTSPCRWIIISYSLASTLISAATTISSLIYIIWFLGCFILSSLHYIRYFLQRRFPIAMPLKHMRI